MTSDIPPYLGIDLGTSTIEITYRDDQRQMFETFTFASGDKMYPTYFAVNKNGNYFFGEKAKDCISKTAFDVCYEFKRFIGKKWEDKTIQKDLQRMKDITFKREDGGVGFRLKGKEFTPIQIYEEIMKEIKKELINHSISCQNAVVTVPISFTDVERKLLTEMFIKKLGFTNIKIMNEPTAAACNFEIEEGNYAIFDYGGGTLDISLIQYYRNSNDKMKFNVFKHDGLSHNGGADIDQKILEYVMEDLDDEIKEKMNRTKIVKLKKECERCKIELSTKEDAKIFIEDEEITITRNDFENECGETIFDPAIERLVKIIKENEKECPIQGILMVGGSSQIPYMKRKIEERTGMPTSIASEPLLAVSKGAGIKGEHIRRDKPIYNDVTSYNVGYIVKSSMGINKIHSIIDKNQRLPYRNTFIQYVGEDNQKSIRINLLGNFSSIFDMTASKIGDGIINLEESCKANTPVTVTVVMNEEGKLFLSFKIEGSSIQREYEMEIDLVLKQ